MRFPVRHLLAGLVVVSGLVVSTGCDGKPAPVETVPAPEAGHEKHTTKTPAEHAAEEAGANK